MTGPITVKCVILKYIFIQENINGYRFKIKLLVITIQNRQCIFKLDIKFVILMLSSAFGV